MRVAGAQGLARAGLSEHTIALLARWGSSAVRTYIRKAPLSASHCLAAVALAGWERNAASTPLTPFPRTSVAIAPRSKAKSKATAAPATGADHTGRLSVIEMGLRALQEWRTTVANSPPPVPVPVVISPEASVPAVWDRIDTAFTYVISVRSKCHKVAVGYPQHPREWRSCCGWAFGIADVARPVLSLPACHKLICERCLPVEREAARSESAANVREVGGQVSMQDCPPSIDP